MVRFAESADIPVITSWRHHDGFPNDHPLFLGCASLGTSPTVWERLARTDVMLVLGNRLQETSTDGYVYPLETTRVFQVDIDPNALVNQRTPEIGVVGDAGAMLALMCGRLTDPMPGRDARRARNLLDRSRFEAARALPETVVRGDGVPYADVVRALTNVLSPETIIASDAGNFYGWLSRHYSFRRPHTYLGPASGAMGYGLPSAIGAKIARPDLPVVSVSGDGGFLMTVAELETAARYGVGVTAIVLDNARQGTIRMHQEAQYPGRVIATELGATDLSLVARGLGLNGHLVTESEDFEPALRASLQSGSPSVIQVRVDREQLSVGKRLPLPSQRDAGQDGVTRRNPLTSALAEGRLQVGTWINLIRTPSILTLLQSAGLDFVRIDMEHSSPSIETVADMAVLSRALQFPILVRPPSADREWITRLLDAGVWGLHIPQVDTPDIARSVVEAARYAPQGMRGIAGLGPHNDFVAGTSLAELNEQVHITVMLESAIAFDNLDEIVATPGIDAVTLGPSDLAQELGIAGTADERSVIDGYRARMIESARRHGKDVAMLCNSIADAIKWANAGIKMIVISSDVAILSETYSAMTADVRAGSRPPPSVDAELEFERVSVVADVIAHQPGGLVDVAIVDRGRDGLVLCVQALSAGPRGPERDADPTLTVAQGTVERRDVGVLGRSHDRLMEVAVGLLVAQWLIGLTGSDHVGYLLLEDDDDRPTDGHAGHDTGRPGLDQQPSLDDVAHLGGSDRDDERATLREEFEDTL